MQQKNNPAVFGIIAVVLIGAIIAGTIILKPKDTASPSNQSPTTSGSNSSSSNSSANYKDGTYSATGSYSSPGGNEEIKVIITISNGKIADSSVTPQASSRESEEYQIDFANNYKSLVTGKSVASLSLSHVAGSSLTSIGFNEALDAIRSQAQS